MLLQWAQQPFDAPPVRQPEIDARLAKIGRGR